MCPGERAFLQVTLGKTAHGILKEALLLTQIEIQNFLL